jgi:hypothetical protein
MKYKLAFVKECKEYRHDFWYKDELKELMARHGMNELYESKIKPVRNNRWNPNEIFEALEQE